MQRPGMQGYQSTQPMPVHDLHNLLRIELVIGTQP